MTITIPSGRTLPLKAKGGGGFESNGLGVGTNIDGQEITLTGSGFGVVSNPLPTAKDLFDDYAGAADGVTVPSGNDSGAKWPGTDNHSFQDDFEFDSAITLGSRPFAALAKGPKAHLDRLSTSTSSGPARKPESFYSTHWIYLHSSPYGESHPSGGASFKFARYWSVPDGFYQISWLFRNGAPTGLPGQITGHFEDPLDDPYYNEAIWEVGAWNRVEYEVSDAVDNGDGTRSYTARGWINGKLINFYRGSEFDAFSIPTKPIDDSLTGISTRLIGSDPSSASGIDQDFRMSVAEVIERSDSARVELSNSLAFDDSTTQRRFCQIVSSWSDDSITIPSAFIGDLDPTAPIYAHIFPAGGASDSVINYGQVN